MKTVIFGLIAVLVLVFFLSYQTYKVRHAEAKRGVYETTVVEGCQYLMCPSYYGYFVLSHKGNCTNSIHVYRVENR